MHNNTTWIWKNGTKEWNWEHDVFSSPCAHKVQWGECVKMSRGLRVIRERACVRLVYGRKRQVLWSLTLLLLFIRSSLGSLSVPKLEGSSIVWDKSIHMDSKVLETGRKQSGLPLVLVVTPTQRRGVIIIVLIDTRRGFRGLVHVPLDLLTRCLLWPAWTQVPVFSCAILWVFVLQYRPASISMEVPFWNPP